MVQVLRKFAFSTIVAALLVSLLGVQLSEVAEAASPTGFEIAPEFRSFYDGSGGLAVFGYAVSSPRTEDGRLVQYFERQRMEHYPENTGTPYEVLLGRLGANAVTDLGIDQSSAAQPVADDTAGKSRCLYFNETGHKVCGGFYDYWTSRGLEFGDPGVTYRESLALFGFPLTEEFVDPATGLTVQYFERARFEWHPEHVGTPYAVLLGQLGRDELALVNTYAEAGRALTRPLNQFQRTIVQQPAAPVVQPAPAQPAPAVQPSGAIYWGAWIDGVPWDMNKVRTYENALGKGVSIIHWGQPWERGGKYQPFYAGDFQRVRDHGAIPLIDWGSWDFSKGTNQPDYTLAAIISGKHDAHIRNWATGARDWGQPMFLRFNWEMNGNWQFPWSEQLNGNKPGEYVAAWRHVHDIFTQVGATNVTWVWSPNTVYPGGTSLASLYPGDAYVDWLGVDGYNWGAKRNHWQSFEQVFSETYNELIRLAPGKPIMIAETGSAEQGGSKADWLTDALTVQLPMNFPEIKALVWFNWNDGDASLEWPLESSASSIAAARDGLSSDYYVGHTGGTLNGKKIVAPSR